MSLIDFVRGRVVERGPDYVVVAAGGFGLRIGVATSTAEALPEPGEEALVYTHLQVREDGMALFGFASPEERALFNQLISVSGVGPRVAMGALSAAPAVRLAAMIAAEDVAALAKLPGIGRKTASRIVLDLKGKLVVPETAAPVAAAAPASGPIDVAAAALRELGFTAAEVTAAVAALPRDRELSDDEAVLLAFQYMGSRR